MKKLNEVFSTETLKELEGVYLVIGEFIYSLIPESEVELTRENFKAISFINDYNEAIIYTIDDFNINEDYNYVTKDGNVCLFGEDTPTVFDELFEEF